MIKNILHIAGLFTLRFVIGCLLALTWPLAHGGPGLDGPLVLAQPNSQVKPKDSVAAGDIAVIYPDVSEPSRSIFAKIIEGIEEKLKTQVRTYPITANPVMEDLNTQLKRANVKVVIALGRQGVNASLGLDRDIPVVVGGVFSVPDSDKRDLTGMSMTPDPMLLFTRLRSLLPEVKKVVVVYDPQHNEWLIKLAREAAKAQGLELQALVARDKASAVRQYAAAFDAADSQHSALWLPQDPTTVDETTILPLVLQESWSRGVPIFSSSLLHVKKGVLFALYPNNLELGRNLAASALAALKNDGIKKGVMPLRTVQMAVNLRTASHIGLRVSAQQEHGFDFVFSEE